MGKKENIRLLKEATDRLIKFVQNNPNYHKSYGMGESLSNYVNQLERDLHKKKRRYKTYLPGTIVYVHFGMNFGEEFSKTHYAITLSKNDNKNKRTVTVIPLTSKSVSYTHLDVYKRQVITIHAVCFKVVELDSSNTNSVSNSFLVR